MASEVINAVLSAEKAAADSYAESVQKCDLLKAGVHWRKKRRRGRADAFAGAAAGRRSRQERRRGQNSFIPFHLTQAIIN